MKDLIDRVAPSLARIYVRRHGSWEPSGSGFAISATGLIATCHHVVVDYREYLVEIDGADTEGQLVAVNPNVDLAILDIGRSVRPLALGLIDQINIGDDLTWAGFPNQGWLPSWHVGMVSHIGQIRVPSGRAVTGLQLDGTSNRGNSGGPIIDPSTGEVVSIVVSSLGGLDDKLRDLRRDIAERSGMGTVQLMGINPLAAIADLVDELSNIIQLGVAYGISVGYLSKMRDDLGKSGRT